MTTESIKCTAAEKMLIEGRYAAAGELKQEAARLTAQAEALFGEAIAATLESHEVKVEDRVPRARMDKGVMFIDLLSPNPTKTPPSAEPAAQPNPTAPSADPEPPADLEPPPPETDAPEQTQESEPAIAEPIIG